MRCLFVFDLVYFSFPLGHEAHRSATGCQFFKKKKKMSVFPTPGPLMQLLENMDHVMMLENSE